MWNIGDHATKSGASMECPLVAMRIWARVKKARWLMTAPFGSPVVPDV
jgi:hypothetical protein